MRSFLAALLLISSPFAQSALSLSSSSNQILLTDSIELEIELDQATERKLDLSDIREDFFVLDLERLVLGQANRDYTDYRTRWLLKLQPRRSGELRIPVIEIEGERSEPLVIRVFDVPKDQQIQIDFEGSSPPYYPKQALLFVLRIEHLNPLPSGTAIRVQNPDGAKTLSLTQLISSQSDNGWISEQRFATYYSQAGDYRLPSFSIDSSDEAMAKTVGGEIVEINPPIYISESGQWLPAERIRLTDSWQDSAPDNAADRLTREITIEAVGPLAEDLPPIPTPENFRRLSVDLSESTDPFGVTSRRSETWEITTKDLSELQTEATEILWWDVQDEQTRILTIPARSLLFKPIESEPLTPPPTASSSTLNLILLSITATIAIAASIFLAIRLKRQSIVGAKREQELQASLIQAEHRALEQQLFLQLLQSCERNQPEEVAEILVEWAKLEWPEADIDSLDSLCLHSLNAEFNLAVFQLIDHIEYGENDSWDGEALGRLLRAVRRRDHQPSRPTNNEPIGDLV